MISFRSLRLSLRIIIPLAVALAVLAYVVVPLMDKLFGIHIGKDGRPAAAYYLNRQSEMLGLLNAMVGILESQKDLLNA